MRITRDIMLKLARQAVEKKVRSDPTLFCIYLTGSLLRGEAMLGGTADIDLVFIHDRPQSIAREVEAVTEDISLDIAHYSVSDFQQPRALRNDPWLGSFLCQGPLVLHDKRHWFEYTQASVCAQFNHAEYVHRRAQSLAEQARAHWMDLHTANLEGAPELMSYLRALEKAANAIACLNGVPLSERRLFLDFPKRVEALGRPELVPQLSELLMNQSITLDEWESWGQSFTEAHATLARLKTCPPRLAALRLPYYVKAMNALVDDEPVSAMWILLRTWTLTLTCLNPEYRGKKVWDEACSVLQLDPEHLPERVEDLDAFLDHIEELLDLYARRNGVVTSI